MDALLPTLVAAFLLEWGDKTQLLVVALAARYGKVGALIAGVAVAAALNAALAAAGGWLLHDAVPFRALGLMIALALLFAGGGALFPAKTPAVATDWKVGAFVAAFAGLALAEFGDKTQFVTAALSARTGEPVLAAVGATLGVVAASVPAAILGAKLARRVPIAHIRIGVGVLMLLVGGWMALNALRLV